MHNETLHHVQRELRQEDRLLDLARAAALTAFKPVGKKIEGGAST